MEWKKLIFNTRVIVLILFLLFSVVAINPHPFNQGAAIRSIGTNSSAALGGIASPKPTGTPLSRETITAIDNKPIKNADDYYASLDFLQKDEPVQVKTNKGLYSLLPKEKDGKLDLGMTVFDAPTTNIRKGLDLQGGTRIVLQPLEPLSPQDLDILLSNMQQRLNVFGLSDVSIRSTKDLEGNVFILIEVAGANAEEAQELVARQGKFEAKIGNESVFKGGKDITYVCRSADCSGLSPYTAPQEVSANQWASTFQFAITLSNDAAQRMADVTKTLKIQGQYLSQPISLYLDDQLVDKLQIASDLRGRAVTNIAISGPGTGVSLQDSQREALLAMKRLQTILITGSLPVKLNTVKVDTISPVLGTAFIKDAIRMMLLAIAAVAVIIYLRYRKLSIVIPIMITGISEVIIIFGIASLIGWNIDVAAIAGILVAVGTGVDDQIVILDESIATRNKELNWLRRIKNAFFIIFAAYFAGVASMVPLFFAGAGLLKGFAITSIIGITVGVLITRPAFAAVAENLLKEE